MFPKETVGLASGPAPSSRGLNMQYHGVARSRPRTAASGHSFGRFRGPGLRPTGPWSRGPIYPLYFAEMRLDASDPDWDDRDRLLLSTAHNTAILYATHVDLGGAPAA